MNGLLGAMLNMNNTHGDTTRILPRSVDGLTQ